MDDDDESVFDRTVDWAIRQGIETATFHILTPYPGTALHQRMQAEGRMHAPRNWDLYDTRHVVFQPGQNVAGSAGSGLLAKAYREFYRWGSIFAARGRTNLPGAAGCAMLAYAGGWKKFEPMWDWVIRAKQVGTCCRCSKKFWRRLASGHRAPAHRACRRLTHKWQSFCPGAPPGPLCPS